MVQISGDIPKQKNGNGSVDVLLGLQWGDEGKGKVVDSRSGDYDIVARFQGGANAGHTIEFEHKSEVKKLVLHMVPSGIMKCATNVIGPGVVFNPIAFIKEMNECMQYNKDCKNRVFISDRAVLVHPMYIALDMAFEFARKKKGESIGTTAQGIGPSYGEQKYRFAMRVGDIKKLTTDQFTARARDLGQEIFDRILAMDAKNDTDFFAEMNKDGVAYKVVFQLMAEKWTRAVNEIRKSYNVTDATLLINAALADGKKVLAEGAQGTMLDSVYGDYPNVTSSHVISGGVCVGLGVAPQRIGNVIGVVKWYTTKVGEGYFPSFITNTDEISLRMAGNEFGATTGRPRKCGWLDLVQLKYAIMLNGVKELVVLKTDICPLKTVEVVTKYITKDREYTDSVPFNLNEITKVETKKFSGWKIPVGAKNTNQVPGELLNYLNFIENELGIPVTLIGTGPQRDHLIEWKK